MQADETPTRWQSRYVTIKASETRFINLNNHILEIGMYNQVQTMFTDNVDIELNPVRAGV